MWRIRATFPRPRVLCGATTGASLLRASSSRAFAPSTQRRSNDRVLRIVSLEQANSLIARIQEHRENDVSARASWLKLIFCREKISPRRTHRARVREIKADGRRLEKRKFNLSCSSPFSKCEHSRTWKIDKCYPWATNRIICGQLGARIGYFAFRLRLLCGSDATDVIHANAGLPRAAKTQRIQPAINFALYGTRPVSIFRFLLIVNRGVGKKCLRIKLKRGVLSLRSKMISLPVKWKE